MLNRLAQTLFTINTCFLFNVPCPVVWSHHQSPELVLEAAAFSKASGERPISYCSIKRFLLPMPINKNAWDLSVLDVQGTFSLHKELIGNSLFVHRQQTYTTSHTYNLTWSDTKTAGSIVQSYFKHLKRCHFWERLLWLLVLAVALEQLQQFSLPSEFCET